MVPSQSYVLTPAIVPAMGHHRRGSRVCIQLPYNHIPRHALPVNYLLFLFPPCKNRDSQLPFHHSVGGLISAKLCYINVISWFSHRISLAQSAV